MQRFLVYGLVDPRSLLVRYIGKSSSGLRRPNDHCKPYELKKPGHKSAWIASLLADGLSYTVAILEGLDTHCELSAAEQWWIVFGRACGWPLTNLTDGGDGSYGWSPSAETKSKIGAANRGRTQTAEHRALNSAALKGRTFPMSIACACRLRRATLHRNTVLGTRRLSPGVRRRPHIVKRFVARLLRVVANAPEAAGLYVGTLLAARA